MSHNSFLITHSLCIVKRSQHGAGQRLGEGPGPYSSRQGISSTRILENDSYVVRYIKPFRYFEEVRQISRLPVSSTRKAVGGYVDGSRLDSRISGKHVTRGPRSWLRGEGSTNGARMGAVARTARVLVLPHILCRTLS